MVSPARVSIFTRPSDVETPGTGGHSAGFAQASAPPTPARPITAEFFPTARREENISRRLEENISSGRSASPVGRNLQSSRSPAAAVSADGRPEFRPATYIQPNAEAYVARHVEPVRKLQMPHLARPVLRHVVRPMTSQPVNNFFPMSAIPEITPVSARIAPQFQHAHNQVVGGFPQRCQSFAHTSTPYHAPMPDRCISITKSPRCQSFAPASMPYHAPVPDRCVGISNSPGGAPRSQSFAPTSTPYHAAAPAPGAKIFSGATIFMGQAPGVDQRQNQAMHRASTFAASSPAVVQRVATFATHAPAIDQRCSPGLVQRGESFAPGPHRNTINVVPVAHGVRPVAHPQAVQVIRRTQSFVPGNYINVGDDISHEARLNEMQRAVAQCA